MGSISKSFLLLALLSAIVLLISSQVAARDLAETTTEKNNGEVATETTEAELQDAKYGYGGHGGHEGYGGRGGHGGHKGNGGGYEGRGGYGGGCAYGCCRSDYYGRGCRRCCSYAGEAVDAETQVDPQSPQLDAVFPDACI
ncbi:hypothetical protein like AT2G05540 [Hibiscus trionum]|uniref:Glycine rich protein n=1 Tax=Hibiscus trionum TaxID=183268 RepID=A0A9W7LLH6_HIBTR|nr:hypothetical protein like AT2G05540 [Hibiscus trionum]